MKKLLTLFTMLLLCIGSTWAQVYYIPVRRVTSFESGKLYMLYNTAINGTEDRTGFIYVNDGKVMQKYVGTRRNPKQFMTTSTAYLWRVTTGSDYHVALQNESNKKYYGWRQGDNPGDPNNLYLYPWGTLTAKQSDANSQNEDDPTQKTANANITFDNNKVFVIGGTGDGDKYWNGNVDNINKYSDGHPFAFYEVETIDLSGYNVYTGASTTLNESGWKTQSNWSLNDDWNSNGPGYTSSAMWSPICLNGVTATGISLEGWNFRAVLDHSTWTIASIGKIQGGQAAYTNLRNSSTVTMNFGRGHTYNYTIDLSVGTGNVFNLVMTSGYKHSCGQDACNNGTITVNYGTICQGMNRKFNASGSGNIRNLVLQATLDGPFTENKVEDYPLVTYTSVGADNLTVTLSGTGGWRQVASQEALQQQDCNGKYYYVEKNSSGVTLHTFNETSKRGCIVDSDATLSQIDSYDTYDYFTVNPGKTLTVDVADFDLTRITGEGNIILAASTSLTGSISTAATGKLTVNSGVTLTIGGGDSQTNYVSSFTSIDLLGTLEANTIAGSGNLAGTGTVRLLTFPTNSAPTLTDWTGTVVLPEAGDKANLTAIFNAWGNANSTIQLKSVIGYFNASETVNPTLDILSGATVTVNNGSSSSTPVLAKVTGAGTLAQIWSGGSNYTLKIATLTGFTGTLQGTNKPIAVDKLVLASAPYSNTPLIKTSASNVTLEKLYIGLQETTAYSWAINTVEGITGIYVTGVDLVQLAREDATDRISPYYPYIGTGIGKYTVSLNNVDYTDIKEIGDAILAWNLPSQIPVTFTINQPTSGYYRILNKDTQRYVNCTKVDDEATHTSADITGDDAAKTIFYIDEDKNIQAYDNGAYWKGVFRMGRGTFNGGTFGWLTYKHPWQFIEGNTLGTYKLIYGNDTEGKYHATGSGNATYYAELNSDAADADAATWTLVAVTELPNRTDAGSRERGNEITYAPAGTIVPATVPNVLVTTAENTYQCNNLQLTDDLISEFGSGTTTSFTGTNVTYNRATSANQWGTICLPYAVSTDGDVAYYRLVAPVGDQTLRFERVTDPTTTAYEPYLIKKAANVGLTISASDAGFELGNPEPQDLGAHNGFVLKGIMVNTSVIDGDEYQIAKNEDYVAVTDPDAYYFEASSNTFRALNGRFNLKAFRAYLSTTDDTSNARSILGIDISEDGQATGISFVESEDGKTVDVVFDLNGRRLQEAKKGINIINGKKVIK